jgi:hypothetical protein
MLVESVAVPLDVTPGNFLGRKKVRPATTMGRRLRELFGSPMKKIIDALSALTVDEGRPYDVSRSALLNELAALPQPLAACYPAKKQAQYFINITNSTLSHATMPIASTSFFVDRIDRKVDDRQHHRGYESGYEKDNRYGCFG